MNTVTIVDNARFLRIADVTINLPYVVFFEYIRARNSTIVQYVTGTTMLSNDRHEIDDPEGAVYSDISALVLTGRLG